MLSTIRRSWGNATVAALVAGTMVWAGCGTESVVAPVAPEKPERRGGFEVASTDYGTGWTVVASQWVDAGKAATLSGGRITLSISKGVLAQGSQVEIVVNDLDPTFFALEPRGVSLDGTVSLKIDYAGTVMDPSFPLYLGSPVLYGFNPATGVWEPLSGRASRRTLEFSASAGYFSAFKLGISLSDAARVLGGDGTGDWRIPPK